MDRRAKIVATLGPATGEPRLIRRLLRAGADAVRLNLSHGDHATHRRTLHLVRRVAEELGRHVPVIVDLMGPRFRLGELHDGPRLLKTGARVVVGAAATAVDLPVDDPHFLDHLERGERILIDHGLIELEVESKRRGRVTARVVHGGVASTRKGINLPDTTLPFAISPKDRADIRFAVDEGADYLAASYVARARDLAALRTVVRRRGGDLPLIAKLERAAAVAHLDELIEAADAVMVARGDLGVEVPLDRVPVLQKQIIAAGRGAGKPVLIATQMLESMMSQPRPTRAESSDVANAVFDGADALMLSGETAAGSYPIEAVETMARIILEAERYRESAAREGLHLGLGAALLARTLAPQRNEPPAGPDQPPGDVEIADVVAAAAVHAASKLSASHIVAFSQGGFTARRLARYRPSVPTLVFTHDARVARRAALLWGVQPLLLASAVEHRGDLAQLARLVERQLLAAGLARPGECILMLMGYPVQARRLTNMLRIHRIGHAVPKRLGRRGAPSRRPQ